jgi:hypothetical protein
VHYDFRTTVPGLGTVDSDADGLTLIYRATCGGAVAAAAAEAEESPEADAALDGLELYRPTPNPFDHSLSLAYAVGGAGERVSIRVFDLAGRLVRNLVDESKAPGRYLTTWDGRGEDGSRQMNAIYFVHIRIGDERRTVRVAYMR